MLKPILKKPWPYWVGGVALSLLSVSLLYLTDSVWKVGAGLIHFRSPYGVSNVAVVVGAMLAAFMADEFRWRRIKNRRQIAFALLGGIMMGVGARMSMGCNISALLGAIPSMSLHGWVFGFFLFAGAWIGSKLLLKFLL